MKKSKPKTRRIKAWAVVDREYGYVNEIHLHRSIAVKNRNEYFIHDPEHWPVRRLRKQFPVVEVEVTIKLT